jgi:RHS repeat-associated protein
VSEGAGSPTSIGAPDPPNPPATIAAAPSLPNGSAITPRDNKPQMTADLLPTISLPTGGGAIRDMGEKFSVNAAIGTGTLTAPLPLSPGRSGFTPQLSIGYDSGAGNGPFGFGWSLPVPAITRKTDKGLPRYMDGEESDVFILSGAEDLVPVLDAAGNRTSTARTVHGTSYQVSRYRPRIEGLFARIERWTDTSTGVSHWRSISRDNVTTLYGFDASSRIANPDDPRQVYCYLICRTWDDRGNLTVYEYVADDGRGVDTTLAHEANRTGPVRATQRYLKTVRYGNISPYTPDWGPHGREAPLPVDWYFKVVVDYGDHDIAVPAPEPDRDWPVRPDPFSTYRAGFEIRTYRRAQRILIFHNFMSETTAGADCLVRSVDIGYSDQRSPADARNPVYTKLTSVTQVGYRRDGAGYVSRAFPPLELDYSEPVIQPDVLALDADSMANLPQGMNGSTFRWVDLDGEGLSGALADLGAAWGYKPNLSPVNQVTQPDGSPATRARLGPLETLPSIPDRSGLAGQQFLDLDGSGRLDLVALTDPVPGFFRRAPGKTWEPFSAFRTLAAIDWNDPNVRFVDLTGDGLADVLFTQDSLYTYYASLGNNGFDQAQVVRTPCDEERGPAVVLADGTQTIFLADMSGDGMSDLVRVRDGETCYWPNTGYGRFGAKVSMDVAPRFTDQEGFDPRRIRLADVDGSGTTDLIYIGASGVQVWFNQSGNAWSAGNRVAAFPAADAISDVQVTDLLGTGTACLVWSSPLPAQAGRQMLYVDLMGGRKPHLLIAARNNLGAETRVGYAPSTRFYLADKLAGTPWITRLPHVVHVVDRTETLDWIGRNRTVTRYAYHHGCYDGYEREFRGFGMVEQWDTEEYRTDTSFPDGETLNWDEASWSPPVLTRSWFHTGAFDEATLVSQQYASEYWAGDPAASILPDTLLPPGLSPYEICEAYRSLKGHLQRTEVYAQDGSAVAGNPYLVTEQNFTIAWLQPIGPNQHAVFFTHPRETVTYHYERDPAGPRIIHDVTLEADSYGNVLRSVSVGYPRRHGHQPALPQPWKDMLAYDQGRLHLRASEHRYTNALTDPAAYLDAHRIPMPAATTEAEITGASPADGLFAFDNLDDQVWPVAWDGAHDIAYEAVPASDVDGSGALPVGITRRVVSQTRTRYRSDDLTALLPVGRLESLGLPGQTYRAALTPGLLAAIFGALVTDTTLAEGGYVQLAGETGWWVPSGRAYYYFEDTDPATELAAAMAHFFVPRRAVDPFGGVSRVDYDAYDLLPTRATDQVCNTTTAVGDYRVLLPAQITDPNGNYTATAFDTLGWVAGTAVTGKPLTGGTGGTVGDSLAGFTADLDEATMLAHLSDPLTNPAEILASATTRIVADPSAFYRSRTDSQPAPPVVYTLARETHVSDLAPGQETRYQHAFAYCDGFARVIQRKAQAAPGPLTDGGPAISPRWTGSGWTIFDNKGRPVRKYEPFFTATNGFEFAAAAGVSSVFFYDPPGRQVAVLHPDSTWEKTLFGPWRQETWDVGDTVLISDPRADPDVGDHFLRLLGTAPGAFTSWHDQRITGTYGATAYDRAAQQDAAQKAEAYAETPSAAHFDSLGRTCLKIGDNGGGQRLPSRIALDTEGKPLAVFDPLARRAEERCLRVQQPDGTRGYVVGADMAGNPLYHNSIDGGARRGLVNVAAKPIRDWDARGHAFRTRYDPALRPTHSYVSTGGAPEILLHRLVYGEGQAAANLCGRLFRHYDMAGAVFTDLYDYTGNLRRSARLLAADYHQSPDWSALAGLTDPAALDAAAAPLLAPGDRFDASTLYDALNRPIQSVTPHSPAMNPNVIQPSFDEGGLLNLVDAWRQQAAVPADLLDPTTADLHAVTTISYNARGQRAEATTGNGTVTTYSYDPATFRLTRLTTTRSDPAADQRTVQDLAYYYDPVGNITRIHDTADIQNVIFFKNSRVEPSGDYSYDPLYRLVKASGREHLGQSNSGALLPPAQVNNDDSLRTGLPQPGDGNAMGTYTETYAYDPADNITAMGHQTISGSWTRRYAYNEPSQIDPAEGSNRLSATSLPGDQPGGPYHATYSYDAHGNMVQMPHLQVITWDEQDRIASTVRQAGGSPAAPVTYYAYDSTAQRVRKTMDSQISTGPPARQKERIYLGTVEIFREYSDTTAAPSLIRETLHIDAARQTVCLDETRTTGTDPGAAELTRYQYANHLGSAVLELDDQARIISYEEYFPYGSTSYQAVRSQTETPKRYRYTGKERDEENDLCYHGARYYAPWLGRWINCDPSGISGGLNPYLYSTGNPSRYNDPSGRQAAPALQEERARMSLTGNQAVSRPSDAALYPGGPAPPKQPADLFGNPYPGGPWLDVYDRAMKLSYQLQKEMHDKGSVEHIAGAARYESAQKEILAALRDPKLPFQANLALHNAALNLFGSGTIAHIADVSAIPPAAHKGILQAAALTGGFTFRGPTLSGLGFRLPAAVGAGVEEPVFLSGPGSGTMSTDEIAPTAARGPSQSYRGEGGAEGKAYSAFTEGIPARGGSEASPTDENLLASVKGSSKEARSAFVQSSQKLDVAMNYATNSGRRGDLIFNVSNRPDSIVVNESALASRNPHPEQYIVAHPGGIQSHQIESADLVDKRGNWIESYFNLATWK